MSSGASPFGQENEQGQSSSSGFVAHSDVEERSNSKYSARYSRRSLEYTNVRNIENEYVPSRSSEKIPIADASSSLRREESPKPMNRQGEAKDREEDRSARNVSVDEEESMAGKKEKHQENIEVPVLLNLSRDDDRATESARDHSSRRQGPDDDNSPSGIFDTGKNSRDQTDQKVKDHSQFESERSMPWLRIDPHEQNLSEQMFLYLSHQQLMHQIEDLTKRESHACIKQSWDEALRLRDMRNRLELIREKRIFNMHNLRLDDETRSLALASIEKRAKELSLRENACSNSNMYSDEAKDLWQQWVHEDERSLMKEARAQRENVMKILETEWQNLAIKDKEKITHSFRNAMTNDSSFQSDFYPPARHSNAKTKSLLHSAI